MVYMTMAINVAMAVGLFYAARRETRRSNCRDAQLLEGAAALALIITGITLFALQVS